MRLTLEETGEICGIFAGDGSLDKRKPFVRIYLSLDEKDYAYYIARLLAKLIGRPIKIRRDKKNVFIVYVLSEELVNLIKKHLTWNDNKGRTIRLRNLKHKAPFIKGFLKGLLDTDGCTNQGSVEFSTVSKKLVYQISQSLKSLGFEFKICSWEYQWRNERRPAYKVFLKTVESKRLVESLKPNNIKRYKLSDTLIDHHEEEKIIELRKAGMRVYDIAKTTNRCHASVSKMLLKHGLSKKRTSPKEAIKILKLWRMGCNRKDIAHITGKSRKIINWTISKRANLLT